MKKILGLVAATLIICTPALAERGPATSLYWGDTHLHTKLSGDSYGGIRRLSPGNKSNHANSGFVTIPS